MQALLRRSPRTELVSEGRLREPLAVLRLQSPSMKLYVMRHGPRRIAGPSGRDVDRALYRVGARAVDSVASARRRRTSAGRSSSRARSFARSQTAEIVARASLHRPPRVEIDRELGAGRRVPLGLVGELSKRRGRSIRPPRRPRAGGVDPRARLSARHPRRMLQGDGRRGRSSGRPSSGGGFSPSPRIASSSSRKRSDLAPRELGLMRVDPCARSDAWLGRDCPSSDPPRVRGTRSDFRIGSVFCRKIDTVIPCIGGFCHRIQHAKSHVKSRLH